jgi:hypothetical protein
LLRGAIQGSYELLGVKEKEVAAVTA